MKTKLFKNILCIASGVLILVVYLIFYSSSAGASAYIVPFFMLELVIASFSLLWSMNKDDKANYINTGLILLTVVFSFAYVITEAIIVVALADETIPALIATKNIFFYASAITISFSFLYPIYLDFIAKDVKKKELQ